MRLRVPKPLHGWRVFVGEVGVIVLGVLLALLAQQIAENWSWRQQSDSVEQHIRTEISDSASYADERLRLNSCFVGKLDVLERELLLNRGVIARPLFRSRYWTIVRLWSTDAWETAQASQVLVHMDPVRVRVYSAIYRQIDQIHSELTLEQQYVADLALLTRFTGAITDTTRDRLIAAVTRARRLNEMIVRDSRQLLGNAAELNISVTPKTRIPDVPCGSMHELMEV